MFSYMAVSFGAAMGGLYYAEGVSTKSALIAALSVGLAFGVLMTIFLIATTGVVRLLRPRHHEFYVAWSRAHSERHVPPPRGLRDTWRRAPITKEFRQRWERDPSLPPAAEFITAHWEEIRDAEGGMKGRPVAE
jgi:hypothetical protein